MRETEIFYAPDGMNRGHRPEQTRQSTERPASRQGHEFEYDHDDGLVHEHHWARTSPERT
jgi:hypothetical protein